MIGMVLQYTIYGLGILIILIAIPLGILGWRRLSGALRQLQEAQAEGQHISWYTYSPTLLSIGNFHLSPAFLLSGIAAFFPSTGRVWLILRLVVLFIALLLLVISSLFAVRGRRLSQATGM